MKKIVVAALALGLAVSGVANAKWTELAAGRPVIVAKSRLSVAPPAHWNLWSVRPSSYGETWSFDGPLLNRLDFYAPVADGRPLIKEHNKKQNPLPKFGKAMLPSDIGEMFERTNRIAAGTADFSVDTMTPATFAGAKGFRFTYHYSAQDNSLAVKGVATGAVIGGQLYLVTYSAPAIHYFDAGLSDAEAVMASATLR